MSSAHKLSLSSAILININIMLGAGIFINTVELAKRAGVFGAFSYTLVGILMLPLILSIVQLLKLHPQGGFYIFGQQEIHPFVGFMSAWSYFVGKLASAMLIIHTAVLLIQQVIPLFTLVSPFVMDCILLAIFIGLNMFNIRTGSIIQSFFMGFKLIPIFFAILTGLWLFNGMHFGVIDDLWWQGIPLTLPLVLYATVGFEAACSLSSKIENAQQNAPKAILYSYGLVIIITTLYQLLFYSSLGTALGQLPNYLSAFPTLLGTLLPADVDMQKIVASFLHLAIAASALGGSYGILFSNNWNLYTLAQHNHIVFSKVLIQLNRQHIPWLCVLVEGCICLLYLLITHGRQIPLQQTSALGSVCAYSVSVVALLFAKKNRTDVTMNWWIPILGLCNCIIFFASCIFNFLQNGVDALATFTILLIIGAGMFWITHKSADLAQLERNKGE